MLRFSAMGLLLSTPALDLGACLFKHAVFARYRLASWLRPCWTSPVALICEITCLNRGIWLTLVVR